MRNSSDNDINYFVCLPNKEKESKFNFSLFSSDSDYFENQNLLNNLIGTLVKYSHTGKIEPYLAESWTVSDDAKRWSFKIRDNLYDSNGQIIDAERIAKHLIKRLKILNADGDTFVFKKLVDWDQFIRKEFGYFDGLNFDNNTIYFNFKEPVRELLEILRMVHFGLWPDKHPTGLDFDSINQFVSTGAYTLDSNSTKKRVILNSRSNWFSFEGNIAQQVIMSTCTIGNIPNNRNTLIRIGSTVGLKFDTNQFNSFLTAPTILTSAILSYNKPNSVFNDVNIRKKFARALRIFSKNSLNENSNNKLYYFANSFYAINSNNYEYINNSPEMTVPKDSTINALLPENLSTEAINVLKLTLKLASDEIGVGIEFELEDRTKSNWLDNLNSNRHYDIRITPVDTGASFIPEAIEMMFCTKLGVSFTDTNGDICRLIYQLSKGEYSFQSAAQLFEKYIEQQASVIPIYHSGILWLQSKEFGPFGKNTGTNHPRFDQITSNNEK